MQLWNSKRDFTIATAVGAAELSVRGATIDLLEAEPTNPVEEADAKPSQTSRLSNQILCGIPNASRHKGQEQNYRNSLV